MKNKSARTSGIMARPKFLNPSGMGAMRTATSDESMVLVLLGHMSSNLCGAFLTHGNKMNIYTVTRLVAKWHAQNEGR